MNVTTTLFFSQLIVGYQKSPIELIRRAFKYTVMYDDKNLSKLIHIFINNKTIFNISTWGDVIVSSIQSYGMFSVFIRDANKEIATNVSVTSKILKWLLMYALMDITDFEYKKIGHDIVNQHYLTIFDHPNFEVASLLETCNDNIFIKNSLNTKQNGVVYEAINSSKRKAEIFSGMYAITSSDKYLPPDAADIFVW